MTQYINVLGEDEKALTLPDNFKLVSSDQRSRNNETVTVERYQESAPVVMNGPHITVVYGDDDRLISYNNLTSAGGDNLPSEREAVTIARWVFENLDADYAAGLSFMRVDRLTRTYNDEDGNEVEVPMLWVKFAHTNGSYNWVSVGENSQVLEVERESEWDYWQSRRATEEWNYDEWVLARMGMGPQPASPEALA